MKDFPRKLCYSIAVIFLSSCASQGNISDAKWHRDMINYSNNGQCAEALLAVESATIEFTWKLMFKGTVHSVCFHDSEKYFAYFTLAARYGNKVAAEKLIERGKPVPPADLATTRQPSMSEIEALLIGISRGIEKSTNTPSVTNCNVYGSGKSVTCTSY